MPPKARAAEAVKPRKAATPKRAAAPAVEEEEEEEEDGAAAPVSASFWEAAAARFASDRAAGGAASTAWEAEAGDEDGFVITARAGATGGAKRSKVELTAAAEKHKAPPKAAARRK
jgi:hypothetical protein